MLKFSKRDSKRLFKEVARLHGVSVSEVREQMELAIENARNNPDPQKQASSKSCLGTERRHQKNLFVSQAGN